MCPTCRKKLGQLGDLVGPGQWQGDNLYECFSCPYPANRYVWDGTKFVPPSSNG